MLSMSINHPDIIDFINVKKDLNEVTNANISVRVNDEFMKKIHENEEHTMEFYTEATGEKITRTIPAKDLLFELAKGNHYGGEPGILFWDRVKDWSIMSEDEDYEYKGTNPCGK